MWKGTLLFLVIAIFYTANSDQIDDITLAKKIKADPRLPVVYRMAQELLRTGLNAGGGYSDVWIRDSNSFLEVASTVVPWYIIRQVLINFYAFQCPDGGIMDGYNPKTLDLKKNNVETDQETSLIQATYKYIQFTGDSDILTEVVNGKTVLERMEFAYDFLMTKRYSSYHQLIWGGTTIDWGDVEPEDFNNLGSTLDNQSHPSLDIYDQAMWIISIENYLEMLGDKTSDHYKEWALRLQVVRANTMKYLWAGNKFTPHVYLERGSPFPPNFNESEIYFHGGTAVAILAGLLSKDQILKSYHDMQNNVKKAGAQSIGITVYPPYPAYFINAYVWPWSYQNGGDWTWFGGRMVQALILNDFINEAMEAIDPMIDRVIKNNGFFEWYTRNGTPAGSDQFRGSAGVLGRAIQLLEEWANKTLKENM